MSFYHCTVSKFFSIGMSVWLYHWTVCVVLPLDYLEGFYHWIYPKVFTTGLSRRFLPLDCFYDFYHWTVSMDFTIGLFDDLLLHVGQTDTQFVRQIALILQVLF